MKILHIPQDEISKKNLISGIKTVLLEEVEWENKLENIESAIYFNSLIEEENEYCINNKNKVNDYNDILKYSPDFVIFDGFYSIKNYFISKFLLKHKIPYFIKPHSAFGKEAQKNGIKRTIKKLIANKLIFDKFLKKSEGILFLNEAERENSVYKKQFSFILPNGINGVEKEIMINKYMNNEEIRFMYLGRIDFYAKGLDLLLDVITSNNEYFEKENISFNFFGGKILQDGKLSREEEILYEATKKLDKIIKINNPIYERNLKMNKIAENDIFILLSRYEGMPMVILESLVLGLPCFVSKGTGMGEIIEENNAGWYWKEKEKLFEKLKKAIEEYKNNKEEYKRNSLKLANKYLWKNLIKDYEKEYKKIFKQIKNKDR